MSFQYGRPAQDEFKLLCSRAQVTCNSSVEDDHGWDFMVEYVPREQPHQPQDKIPGPRCALVQVKSAEGPSPRTKMKVSNALKLAKSELPCFVVLFQNEANGASRIYVQHFWDELMKRALHRGRKASAEGKQTHELRMQISFSDKDDHTDDAISWMIATIEQALEEYGSKKRNLYNTLGYDGRNYRAEVTFSLENGIEDIIDHQLGLTEEMPVSNIRVVDCRFGIDAPVPIIDESYGFLQLRPQNNIKCKLVFQNETGSIATFQGVLKSPAIPNLPSDQSKYLVQTWSFNIVIFSGGEVTFQFREFWESASTIEQLIELSRFLSWNDEQITMQITTTDLPPISFQGQFNSHCNGRLFATLGDVAKMLQDIGERAGCPTILHTFSDLHESLRELTIFHDVLTAKHMRLRTQLAQHDSYLSRILGYFDFEVGNYAYFAMFDTSVTRLPVTEGEGTQLYCGPRILRACLVGTDPENVTTLGREKFKTEEEFHGDECLSIGNLRVLLRV